MALRFGIMGAGRGSNFIESLKAAGAEVVALCDQNEKKIAKVLEDYPELEGHTFADYDEFLKADMDGIILANYFCEHAPFAIKALNAGKPAARRGERLSPLDRGSENLLRQIL